MEDIVIVLEKNRLNYDIEIKNIFIDCKSLIDNLDIDIKLPRLTINRNKDLNQVTSITVKIIIESLFLFNY